MDTSSCVWVWIDADPRGLRRTSSLPPNPVAPPSLNRPCCSMFRLSTFLSTPPSVDTPKMDTASHLRAWIDSDPQDYNTPVPSRRYPVAPPSLLRLCCSMTRLSTFLSSPPSVDTPKMDTASHLRAWIDSDPQDYDTPVPSRRYPVAPPSLLRLFVRPPHIPPQRRPPSSSRVDRCRRMVVLFRRGSGDYLSPDTSSPPQAQTSNRSPTSPSASLHLPSRCRPPSRLRYVVEPSAV
ncbi:hypothetical protein C8R43DRAFT_488300 [Mycena crocata]|nr:hypothetical protein C8R43DRAFT_488300 [Mycena crocata]